MVIPFPIFLIVPLFLSMVIIVLRADGIVEHIREVQHDILEKLQASNSKYNEAADEHRS